MKKRLIAFLLVLIMVLGMLPVSAFAADGDATKYTYTLYYKWNDGTDRTWNTDDTSPTAETSFTHYLIQLRCPAMAINIVAGRTRRMLRLRGTRAASRSY